MDPDSFKPAWKTQSSQTRLAIDSDLLLEELRRKQRCFAAAIFWRDVREVGISLLMVPLWIYLGVRLSLPGTWHLVVPAVLWVAGYMLVDRMRYKRQPLEPGEPLRQRVESLITQVEHQIWLLRHLLWWYLLPLALSLLPFVGQVAWQERSGGWWTALSVAVVFALVVIVFAVIYWLNQYAVGSELEPRRRELKTLLMSLADETAGAS